VLVAAHVRSEELLAALAAPFHGPAASSPRADSTSRRKPVFIPKPPPMRDDDRKSSSRCGTPRPQLARAVGVWFCVWERRAASAEDADRATRLERRRDLRWLCSSSSVMCAAPRAPVRPRPIA